MGRNIWRLELCERHLFCWRVTRWTSATCTRPTLRSYGYRVVNAATSVGRVRIAVTRGTDIVVTHVHIAGSMSGLELTRRLRIHTRTTTVPIIALTSGSRPQDGNVALNAGANMFLEIPVPAVVLCDQVARLLDESATPSRYTSSQGSSSGAQGQPWRRRHGQVEVSSEGATTVDRNCPQCLTLLEYRGGCEEFDGDQSRSPRTLAVRVRLVL